MPALLLVVIASGLVEPLGPDQGGAVIKTWGFLKQAASELTEQSETVLAVRKNLDTMTADFQTQRETWAKAKADLEEETRQLELQLSQLTPASEVAQQQAQVSEAAAQQAGAEQQLAAVKQQVSAAAEQRAKQLASMNKTAVALLAQQGQVVKQDTAAKAELAKTRLATDKVRATLSAQVADLQRAMDQVKAQNVTVMQQADANETLATDAHAALLAEIARLETDLAAPKVLEDVGAQKAALKADQEKLWTLQSTFGTTSASCQQKTSQLEVILEQERAKVTSRQSDLARCTTVHATSTYLVQALASCRR